MAGCWIVGHVSVRKETNHIGRVLDNIARCRGPSEVIVVDNGPEFTSRALDEWAYRSGVRLHFIEPGKPVQNCFIESFNEKFREECLDEHWFTSLNDARITIEAWRRDFNGTRPHSSLNNLTPTEFALRAKAAWRPQGVYPGDLRSNRGQKRGQVRAIGPRTQNRA